MNRIHPHQTKRSSDIRNQAPRVIDLRRFPTEFTGKGKSIDGIIRRFYRVPIIDEGSQSSPVQQSSSRRLRSWQGIAALMLFATMALHGATIGSTRAYFSDAEVSRENVLEAGSIDFSLLVASSSSTFSRVNCVPYATTTETVIVVPATSTNPFQYYPQAVNFAGDMDFCRKIHVAAYLDDELLYQGELDGLTSAATEETGEWRFVFATKSNQTNKQCSFDIVFKGWQTRHDHPSYELGGFTNKEAAHVSLATWGIRINKVHTPDKEWVELYNQTNKTIDISGWEICDNNACDTIPPHTKIKGQRFAIITGSASTFVDWPAPKNVKRIVLDDGTIGDGLDDAADMLVLRRGDGEVMDALNWGAPSMGWGNASTTALWNPGIAVTATTSIFARIPTGFDTNSPSDWQSRLTPTVDLEFPDENEEYTWKWAHHMNIEWEAENPHGPDNKLSIGLYYIKDKDGNGVISSGDTIHHITKKTKNDGHHGWDIPVGYTGYMWIRLVAISPENPLLISQTTSGRILLESILPGHDWSHFNNLFGIIDGGEPVHDFAPDVEGNDFISPLFLDFPVEGDEDADEEPTIIVPTIDDIFDFLHLNTAQPTEEATATPETNKSSATTTPEVATTTASTTPPTTKTGTSTASVSIQTSINTGNNDTSTSTETVIVDVSTTTESASVSFEQHITASSSEESMTEETEKNQEEPEEE